MLGQIDRDAVRPCELDLDVASLRHLFRSRVRTVRGARLFDPRSRLRHVLDFDAEVVQAGVPGRALCGGGVVVLEFQDREVYVAVAQIVALGSWGVDLTHLFQAEALDVEPRRRLWVPRANRDVPNSSHYKPPFSLPSFRVIRGVAPAFPG